MDLFHNIDIINKALDATMLKYNVISDNISNVDTPGYKRKDVVFESLLAKEIDKKGIKNINSDNINPVVYIDKQNYMYKMDGNNIDIDIEMAESAKVKLKYDALITRTSAQLSRFKTILQTIK
ncbi:flagellar basal body rod protein FlgB [Cellulosilyticum sp. I15G10I2]|uniref:flagellar basal body rod protein FlgB n=1 Tax=Cellulosilyticum sp. I15G10I2 TaxID=1892843 RepID=UPI00085C3AFC|nr:flagellar basal body rod protein FlgB [Cellulosilyticum sp. I15G10I2]